MSSLHRSLANAQLCPRVVVCLIFEERATTQTLIRSSGMRCTLSNLSISFFKRGIQVLPCELCIDFMFDFRWGLSALVHFLREEWSVLGRLAVYLNNRFIRWLSLYFVYSSAMVEDVLKEVQHIILIMLTASIPAAVLDLGGVPGVSSLH